MLTTLDLPHTSDGLMHIARSAAYLKELEEGQFPVRWAHQFNYGYGTPIFNFFNPLPYMVGAFLLLLGFSLAATLKTGFIVTYILGGIFMLLLARSLFRDKKVAILVTVMFQYVPFRLVEMHTRGDLGSLYSYMTIPLVLYAIIKFVEKMTYPRFFLLAISTALLPFGHNINGFVFFCLSGIFVLFLTLNPRKIILTWTTMGIGLLSISYYLLPALLELKYLNGYIFSKHLFYMHFPEIHKLLLPNITNNPSLRVEEVSVQLGLFNLIAMVGLIVLLIRKKIPKKYIKLSYFLLLLTGITFFLMLPVSKPLWENFKYLRQFQFPWRFLLIPIIITPLAAGIVFENIRYLHNKTAFLLLIAAIILSTVFYWGPYQGYQKIDELYYRNYPKSTNYFAEVNTIWMEKEPQDYPIKRVEVAAGNAEIGNVDIQPEIHTYEIKAFEESTIVDRTYFYPGWKVYVNGNDTLIEFQDPNYRGLITYKIPEGDSSIEVKFTQNKIMTTGNYITLLVLFFLALGWAYYLFKKTFNK